MSDELTLYQRRQLRQLQIDFHEACKPFLRVLCDIENRTLHGAIIYGNGRFERVERYSPEDLKLRAQVLEVIEDLKSETAKKAEALRSRDMLPH